MAELLHVPEIVTDAGDVTLRSWQVTENQPYAATDTLATVETDKAVVDVEAESAGVVVTTLVDEGSTVPVGAPIAVLRASDEQVPDLPALLRQLGVSAPGEERAREPVPEPSGPALEPSRAAPDSRQHTPGDPSSPRIEGQGRVFASPLARRMARDAGLALDDLHGSGPGGRIVRRDVEAAIADRTGAVESRTPRPAPEVPAGQPAGQPAGEPTGQATGQPAGVTEVPHTRARTAIAARMARSKQQVPHFYLRDTLPVDELVRLRRDLAAQTSATVSLNDLLIRAVALAHAAVPAMNVIWTDEAVRAFPSVDVGVAVATDAGLVTPVVREADRMSITAIAATVRDYVDRARSGQLRQDELEGGTVTVTNLGMHGIEEFSAIINPPQASILAVGAAREEPIVRDGRVEVATLMRVTLSVDHRPVDGVVAAEWMSAFRALVENPLRLLV
ncbi:2-oxo acid dehydrogenase subunit E2 [Actinobacteria bacterium YIM 96077]|uniref:Dihydrolipoamide acetyltransferase component of pyruvate dehydrogenase complex n=1 Tax=Phytoactinopolyspora halophila TaxID=1981511 RepID=A0A329R0C3_9ACTN|nr:dihydrolipoamide acetyltransferase family protein [Phytoactinopolyspora halophila]AYY13336.1 2-oxo acid dehydrogenase subunit E2 [Actinobacteria bacterium YIM 96077]RAW17429.1 2-oxo acid dehydrogenase subunit E2 [Phytoactinopolyspora halophila]